MIQRPKNLYLQCNVFSRRTGRARQCTAGLPAPIHDFNGVTGFIAVNSSARALYTVPKTPATIFSPTRNFSVSLSSKSTVITTSDLPLPMFAITDKTHNITGR